MDLKLRTDTEAVIPASPLSPRLPPIPRMREHLTNKIHATKVRNGSFWCDEELQQLWSNEAHAEEILGFEDRAELHRAQNYFYKILSILVYIGSFTEQLFKDYFFHSSSHADIDLPFELDWLSSILDKTASQLFFDNQHMSLTIRIVNNTAYIHRIHPAWRWPFEREPELIGIGGYGTVYRALVPPRYIKTIGPSGESSNDKVSRLFSYSV